MLEVCRWILAGGLDSEVVEPGTLRKVLRQDAQVLARMLVSVRIPAGRIKIDSVRSR
jgi:hypothetical protein